MNKLIIVVLGLALTYACSNDDHTGMASVDVVLKSDDLTLMQKKRAEILVSYDSIGNLLAQLDLAISEKDTTIRYPLVTVFQVRDTVFNNFVSIQGNVETSENILIYPEYQGVLSNVSVRQGQRVTKGQLLAKIDDDGLASQLAQVETQYNLAKTTFERQERLWKQKIGSEMQYLEAKANMEAAESTVNQMRRQLDKISIRAPFSGVIDEIIIEQGQVVAPGQALMRLVNLSNMRVKASVPETYLQSVVVGSTTEVTFPAIQTTVEGKVTGVGSYINPTNRTFQIEVAIPNTEAKVKPNLMANLRITNYSNEKAFTIPANSIQENAAGDKFVFVVADVDGDKAKVVRTQIETGNKNGGFVEVLSGLSDGSAIVNDGALTLKDGARISIQQAN